MELNFNVIPTERLILRRWVETDHEPFIKLNQDKDVMEFFPKTLRREESLNMINKINEFFNVNNYGLYAVEHQKTRDFLGYTGFAVPSFECFFTPCMEIGWRFKKEAWGFGYATEAAKACLEYGFQSLGFDEVFSFTSALNLRSEGVMKRIGMSKVAEFDHPKLTMESTLCKHVLYRIDKH